MICEHDITRERVLIQAGDFRLSGELAYGSEAARAAVLVLGPHPYMGGTMENALVVALHQSIAAAGAAVLRFDYPGVGDSVGPPVDVAEAMAEFWKSGHAPQDPGLALAGKAALDWLRRQSDSPLAIVGYSFGSFVASSIAPADTRAAVVVSPTLSRHSIQPFPDAAKLGVVFADNDFATPVEITRKWISELPREPKTWCVPGGDHFFRGRESEIAANVAEFLMTVLNKSAEASC